MGSRDLELVLRTILRWWTGYETTGYEYYTYVTRVRAHKSCTRYAGIYRYQTYETAARVRVTWCLSVRVRVYE